MKLFPNFTRHHLITHTNSRGSHYVNIVEIGFNSLFLLFIFTLLIIIIIIIIII